MTDKLTGVVVTFDLPLRDDDAETVINAIRLLRHVADVQPVLDDYREEADDGTTD